MREFMDTFNSRRDEIRAFLQLMNLLEEKEIYKAGSLFDYLSEGKSSDEKKEIAQNIQYSKIINIMKSDLCLMLYNFIEYSVSGLVDEVYQTIRANGLCFTQVSAEIRLLWRSVQLKPVTDPSSNYDTHFRINQRMIDHVLEKKIIELESRETISGGNLDDDNIIKSFRKHGMDVAAESKKYQENHFPLLLRNIKNDRNALAHGATSFEESLRDKLISDLKMNMDDVCSFLTELIQIVSSFIASRRYMEST